MSTTSTWTGAATLRAMQTQTIKVKDLAPADYNPRLALRPGDPEYDSLQKSIAKFGLVEPIVWNSRSGHVVGGHQRLQVLLDAGWADKEIVVSVVDLDEADERALNIALNKIEGRWDDAKLAEVLSAVEDAGLLELTGFTPGEMDDVLRRVDQAGAAGFLDDFLAQNEGEAGGSGPIQPLGPGDGDDSEQPGQGPGEQPLPPGQDGKAWFNLSYSVSSDEREIVLAGLRKAKEVYDLQTSPKALVAMCREFLTTHADTPAAEPAASEESADA